MIAVSGGADSVALMHAANRWRRATGGHIRLVVATIDHGLRPQSRGEAQFVAAVAGQLGLPHEILHWQGAKPATGMQNAARNARYGLLRAFAAENHLTALVTAHTQEDQAETLMMRLARGSGLDGLAGIAAVTHTGEMTLIRPFLDISKARLKAFLRSIGESWIEDPSNADANFERVRVRRALGVLRKQGLDTRAIALSAKRLGRAKDACASAASNFAASHLQVFPEGWARVALAAFRSVPAEIAINVLSKVLAACGGGARQVRLSKIEALHLALLKEEDGKWTLGGCVLRLAFGQITIIREEGRLMSNDSLLAPGERAIWDGRFEVSCNHQSGLVRVTALRLEGWKRLDSPLSEAPKAALRVTPAFWLDDQFLAAPLASTASTSSGDAPLCRAAFVNPFDEKI
ncbi:MAG: tRNA lysidine(34) synthetase TilS [Chitinophagales bacterium]|nr:tRNA lysidine(34) synthetase TilS [Hyphomicrobiales bacterium]